MRLDVVRNGSKVEVRVDEPGQSGRYMPFVWECGTDWAALLLEEWLRTRLWQQIAKVREQAYEAGWNEGRSHRFRKRDWFPGWLKDKL